MSGDSQTGTLYLIDVPKGTAAAVLQDALLQGTSNARAAGLASIGVNGIKVYGSDLYFTNTAKGKVALNTTSGRPVGRRFVLANYGALIDDLSFDIDGNAYISGPYNSVLLRPAGTTSASDRTRLLATLFDANSDIFGGTAFDRCILYSTFDGVPSGVARINVGI